MEQIILIAHVLIALGIIGLIMIQQGKGADMGASFGAGASQTLFGSGGGGNVLTKATSLLVALFFVTSFGLAVIAKNHSQSAGDVDMPLPSIVESPVETLIQGSDIPEIDSPALSQEALDIDDIPSESLPAEGAVPADIPEL